jgi:hypothetical protein
MNWCSDWATAAIMSWYARICSIELLTIELKTPSMRPATNVGNLTSRRSRPATAAPSRAAFA